MNAKQTTPRTIDEYIAGYPREVQEILEKIRQTIREAAPDAEEAIKYQIPTFTLDGNLISFAAYKTHIGLYPVPTGSERFNHELRVYQAAKSTVRIPLDEAVPFDLIGQMVRYRVQENRRRAEAKNKKR